jgi:hypothetical protein
MEKLLTGVPELDIVLRGDLPNPAYGERGGA